MEIIWSGDHNVAAPPQTSIGNFIHVELASLYDYSYKKSGLCPGLIRQKSYSPLNISSLIHTTSGWHAHCSAHRQQFFP